MTAMVAKSSVTLDDFLIALCSGGSRRAVRLVGFDAMSAGFVSQRITCDRCRVTVSFARMVRHVLDSEELWRDRHREDGPNAGLHRPGDLRPALLADADQQPEFAWTWTVCRSCSAPIIWARTIRGRLMPIDRDPDASGEVILVVQADAEEPLAMHLHTESERFQVDPNWLRKSHLDTCPSRADDL